MKRKKITCEIARNISIVKTLARLGHFPTKETEKEAWFLSVLRSEIQASFKVSKLINRWYDHGKGMGGNVIDLIVLVLKCSVKEALEFLGNDNPLFSFQQQTLFSDLPKAIQQKENKITIVRTKTIEHPALIQYLRSRQIPLEIAKRCCSEVWYRNHGKTFFAIGLENHLGGWELRNKFFKSCNSPKSYTYLTKGKKQLIIVEGMFDLLSLAVCDKMLIYESDIIVLNSIAFINEVVQLLKKYQKILLLLDNDSNGNKITTYLLDQYKNVIDQSCVYLNYKDLNEKLIDGII
ncbi:MAG TPA: DNA primase [Flavobacteriaceae bacterium]|nr:DNA primase [Flavobacteriaceae bacterium]HAT66032.1 DNA primase [Flavobacteriaceae bacterium]|tara:strand:- start:124235 stop:125110 length:876 start_codon:yes stop_codon:yes gene_type:complete